MRRSTDFTSVVRSGVRARGGRIVVHHQAQLSDVDVAVDGIGAPSAGATTAAPLIGFVVSKSVGGSVVRHQVTRRLRAQLADRLRDLPRGSGTVIRALPESNGASSRDLGHDLERALARVMRRA